jgi:hypothetical protein
VNSDLISKHKELQDLFNEYKLKCEEECDEFTELLLRYDDLRKSKSSNNGD